MSSHYRISKRSVAPAAPTCIDLIDSSDSDVFAYGAVETLKNLDGCMRKDEESCTVGTLPRGTTRFHYIAMAILMGSILMLVLVI